MYAVPFTFPGSPRSRPCIESSANRKRRVFRSSSDIAVDVGCGACVRARSSSCQSAAVCALTACVASTAAMARAVLITESCFCDATSSRSRSRGPGPVVGLFHLSEPVLDALVLRELLRKGGQDRARGVLLAGTGQRI